MRVLRQFLIAFLVLVLPLAGCGGGGEQGSGIVKDVSITTEACQPKSTILEIRNTNTQEPQKIQAINFELGTNQFGPDNDNYYSIDKVTIAGTEFIPSANGSVENVIIPAGGIMDIQVTYDPKTKTKTGEDHVAFLDVFLNGPKLGIMQIKLTGKAETSLPNCGQGPAGTTRTFTVNQVQLHIKDGQNQDSSPASPLTDISDPLIITVDGTKATITKSGFPTIMIPAPGFGNVPAVLDSGTYEGTFSNGAIMIDSINLTVAGIIKVQDMKITTDELTVTQGNVSLTFAGSPLDSTGKMTVLLGGKLPSDSVLDILANGVIIAELSLTEQ